MYNHDVGTIFPSLDILCTIELRGYCDSRAHCNKSNVPDQMLDLTFMCCIYSSGTTRIHGPLILEGPTNNLLMCNSLIHMHTLVYICVEDCIY